MKQTRKPILGVTLLEIMLVLAIAAMIIVMSVRYYQTATSSEQSNQVMEQLQSIQVAADELSQASGSYSSGMGSTGANVTPLLPKNGLVLPWGSSITIAAAAATSYSITLTSVPVAICPLIVSRIGANPHYSYSGTCGTTVGSLIIVYTASV